MFGDGEVCGFGRSDNEYIRLEKGIGKIARMGKPVMKSMEVQQVMSDAKFDRYHEEWVLSIKAGEYTLDGLADQVHDQGSPFALRHLKALVTLLRL